MSSPKHRAEVPLQEEDNVEFEELRNSLAQRLGEIAYKYDTDHNEDEWDECLELADAALNIMLTSSIKNASTENGNTND